MDDKQKIKLTIGDASYPMTIDRDDEQLFRDAARRVSDMLNRYREAFPDLSKEQYLAMVAVHNAAMDLEKTGNNDTAPFVQRLQHSIDTLDAYLNCKDGADNC